MLKELINTAERIANDKTMPGYIVDWACAFYDDATGGGVLAVQDIYALEYYRETGAVHLIDRRATQWNECRTVDARRRDASAGDTEPDTERNTIDYSDYLEVVAGQRALLAALCACETAPGAWCHASAANDAERVRRLTVRLNAINETARAAIDQANG